MCKSQFLWSSRYKHFQHFNFYTSRGNINRFNPVQSALNKAPVVVFSSAPKILKTESVGPGPLTLAQPSSLGKQKTSNRRSNGACHFGTSTREAANRLYTLGNSKKHQQNQYNWSQAELYNTYQWLNTYIHIHSYYWLYILYYYKYKHYKHINIRMLIYIILHT